MEEETYFFKEIKPQLFSKLVYYRKVYNIETIRPSGSLDSQKAHLKKEGWAIWNDIQIGRGLNGKWIYGISYSCGTGGYGSGISVWGKAFDSRKECLVFALKEMIEGHKKGKVDKYSVRVLKQVKDLLDEVMGRKVVQLSLF